VLPLHHRAIRLVDGIPQSRTGSLQGAVPDRDKEQNGPSAMDGFVPKTRAPYPPPRQKSTPPTPLSQKRPFILLCPGKGDVNIAVNGDPMAKLPIMHQLRRVAALAQAIVCVAVFCPGASAADSFRTEMIPAAVDAGPYAEFMAGEIQDERELADMAENQRRWFNRITPAGFSWVQPMFPSAAPFDAAGFSESFLDGLLGEDRNSVAVYPLALTLDPMTRETLVYNSDGHLVAVLPSDGISRAWPEDADPARVVLQLDLLPSEDVEPYLYVEGRIAESAKARVAKPERSKGMVLRSLGANEFGFAGAHRLTNGQMRLTVTNGANVSEIYSYTVWHTSTVVVTTWTNEYDEVITGTNLVWHSTSPPFDGIESAWECQTTNLVLSGGVGTWDDADVPTNARVRFYAAAQRADTDADGLTDGAEIFLHRTDPEDPDTDGDGIPDGAEIDLNLNPVEPSDAMEDPDGDGFSNLLEYQLGSPLDNPAWSGEQLVHRLMHANTNHGLRVEVEDSENCGGTGLTQYVTNSLSVPDLLDCGYFLDITVAGNVEDHMSLYDHVYVRALDEKFYFGGDQNYVACSPVAKTGTLNHLILPNSQITLIYDTVSYKHHVNGYAEITGAAVTGVIKVDFKTYSDSVPGPDKPHLLNMDTRQNEEDHYAPFKKCVSHVWSSQSLDMAQYLDGYDDPDMRAIFHEALQWRMTGPGYNGAWQNNHELNLGSEPDDDEMSRFDIEVKFQGDAEPRDYLIVAVIPSITQTDFNQWHTDEGNDMGWLAELPAIYTAINFDQANPIDPEPGSCDPQLWKGVDSKNTYYHPDGFYEMRSEKTAGDHGHQGIYDDYGAGIRSGVSAGSADREAPWPTQWNPLPHVNADVKPFIWAAQMDGNPVEENGATMTDPILHEGVYLGRYFEVRPAIANGNPEPAPGTCP
jgi:hypothetical protein